MILYWTGVLIALCINLAILWYVNKTEGVITLGNLILAITCSLASLLEIGVLIVATLIYILATADTIVIWRSKKK